MGTPRLLPVRSYPVEESRNASQQGGTATPCWAARPCQLSQGGTAVPPLSPTCDLSSFDCSFRDSFIFFTREHFLDEILRVFERVLFHIFGLNSLQLRIVLPFNNNWIKFVLNSLPSFHCFSRVSVESCLVNWGLWLLLLRWCVANSPTQVGINAKYV